MNQLSDSSNYLDIAGLQQLKAKASANPDNKEALQQAAEHFESIFINMMMKSMRKANAVFEEGNPMHSNTTKFFRDMYDQQIATDMASKGSLGLADIIVQQLSNDPKDYKNADILRNDASFQRHEFNVMTKALSPEADAEEKPSGADLFTINQATNFNQPAQNSASFANEFNQIVDDTFKQAGLTVNAVKTAKAPEPASTSVSERPIIDFDSPKAFVSQIWDHAKKAAREIGLNPAVMVAQSALETGWGKHIIDDNNGGSSFNLFNVKAHRDWDGEKSAQTTLEFENGVAVKKREPFRVYNDFSESFSDFIGFLKGNGRYEEALNQTDDAEQFLQSLQDAGYATDPRYADKILGILKSDSFQSIIGELNNSPTIK